MKKIPLYCVRPITESAFHLFMDFPYNPQNKTSLKEIKEIAFLKKNSFI